jgi:hypothetical protein
VACPYETVAEMPVGVDHSDVYIAADPRVGTTE